MVAEQRLDYRGCVITWPEIRIDGARWTVNLASDNPSLLGRSCVFNDHTSLEGAIQQAKRHVDERLHARAGFEREHGH
jgi:hypothetical protein